MKIRIFCILTTLALCAYITSGICFNTAMVYANSAQTHWFGVDAFGAIILEEECPIEVKHETLTFSLNEFPANYYENEKDFLSYSGKVSAEYTFYNPANYSVTATLAFPFGLLPNYFYGWGDTIDDAAKYGVTVNGEKVDSTVRHTYHDVHSPFNIENDLPRLSDEYITDSLYFPTQVVNVYTYIVSGVDREKYPTATAAFDYTVANDKGIIFPDMDGGSFNNKECRLFCGIQNGDTVTVCSVGKEYEPTWKFYQNGGWEGGKEIHGTMQLESRKTFNFEEYALQGWDKSGNISKTDYYNAFVSMLRDRSINDTNIVEQCNSVSSNLMRWYEYSIELSPGETLKNCVDAPMYPDIDSGYNPILYTYTYLLSPASTWKSFGTLDIVIQTPYYLIDGEGFKKTEAGYTKSFNGLPQEDLVFSLATEETVMKIKFSNGEDGWYKFIHIGIPVITVAVFVGIVAVGVVLIVKGNRKS